MTMKPNTELNTMMFFDDALEDERTQLLTELADAVSETRTAADQAAQLNEDGEAGLLRLTEIWCAMNGVPASHAGTFRTPLVDCTKTPTKEHFDLGTREHERERREAYQRRLDARAESHRGEETPIWCPEFPEGSTGGNEGSWDGLALD